MSFLVSIIFKSVFQMTVEKPITKQIFRPITTRANSAMKQSEFLAITCYAQSVQSDIGSGFASDWLKNWREIFNPITKRCNRNLVLNYFQQSFENCSHTEDNQSISPRLEKQFQVVVIIGWEPSKTTLQGRGVRFWRCTHSKNVSVDEGAPNYGALGHAPLQKILTY